jgi:nitrogen fixation/metabolism regulation signal transduction histidine kinase
MGEAATAAAAAPGRHQRRLRNYLLDSHFQLKYSGYLVLIAVVLSASLGFILWRTSLAVIEQSQQAVDQGEQVVSQGREVVKESQKVSEVVKMNIVKDPVYADNPALLDAFKTDAAVQDERLKDQQFRLEQQAATLRTQSIDLARRQRTLFTTLCGVLTLLVMFIGVAGIVVTHKVAGPIHKMKGQIKAVADGHLAVPGNLRKGDELVDFFETFREMVVNLRKRQENEIALLDAAISTLERGPVSDARTCESCGQTVPAANADQKALKPLHEVRAEMKAALDT